LRYEKTERTRNEKDEPEMAGIGTLQKQVQALKKSLKNGKRLQKAIRAGA
jgi:hypothetical protein